MLQTANTHTAVGFSQNPDIEQAAKQAAFQAKSLLRQDKVDLALVIYTGHYHPKRTLPILQAIFNTNRIIGCCSPAIIVGDRVLSSGLAVLAIRSDDWEIHIASSGTLTLQDPLPAATVLAKNITEKFGVRGRNSFLFFADGHAINERLVMKGLQDVLGGIFPIIGAGTCNDFNPKTTPQICETRVTENIMTGLMFGGHSRVGVGSRHGWKPLGKPRTITGSFNNILQSIDNKPAADLYKSYFGDELKLLMEKRRGRMSLLYPLGLFLPETNRYLIRNIIDMTEDGSIVCHGEVPTGLETHIMIGSKESCMESALIAVEEARHNLLGQRPKFLLILESIARLKLLNRNAAEELSYIKKIFPDVPIIGLYTNGEIVPAPSSGNASPLHLQSHNITVLAVS